MTVRALLSAALLPLSACATMPVDLAPASTPVSRSVSTSVDIHALVARMSLERKIAQLIMPDIASITPADMRT